jgi:hypothetical protein
MATITDRTEFDHAVTQARHAHQLAIKKAQSDFESAHQRRLRKWRERVVAAKAQFDALKSLPDPSEEFGAIKQEYEAASSTAPDLEGPRKRLGKDVQAADEALNEAINAARQKLLTPSNPRAS